MIRCVLKPFVIKSHQFHRLRTRSNRSSPAHDSFICQHVRYFSSKKFEALSERTTNPLNLSHINREFRLRDNRMFRQKNQGNRGQQWLEVAKFADPHPWLSHSKETVLKPWCYTGEYNIAPIRSGDGQA